MSDEDLPPIFFATKSGKIKMDTEMTKKQLIRALRLMDKRLDEVIRSKIPTEEDHE